MWTIARQFLVAFLAAWLPFCCCQVRAAAAAVAHAAHHDDVETVRACCADEQVDGGCCSRGGEAEHDGRAPSKADCCVACKERALPSAPPAIDVDTVGTIDFIATAVLAVAGEPAADACPWPGAFARDTGPPGAPDGRTTLALHSVLVI